MVCVTALGFALVVGDLAAQRTSPDTAAALGCWDMHLGPWRSTGNFTGPLFEVPPRVRLTAEADSSFLAHGNALWMPPAPGAMPSPHRYTWWLPLGGDSLRLVWSTGFAVIHGIAHQRGDTLAGTMIAGTDVFPQRPDSALLTAVRVACEAPLPHAARARYEYPRGVELSTGDSVRLGEPLPPGIESVAVLEPRFGRETGRRLLAAVVGSFAGATEVHLQLDANRRVRRIRMAFPPDAYESLRDRLSASLGAPHSLPGSKALIWTGHMVSLVLTTYPSGVTRVSIYDPVFPS